MKNNFYLLNRLILKNEFWNGFSLSFQKFKTVNLQEKKMLIKQKLSLIDFQRHHILEKTKTAVQ